MTRLGRWCVGLGLLAAWGSLARVTHVDGLPYAPAGLARLPVNAWVTGAATLGYLVTWVAFVRGRRPDTAAAVLVALLAAGTQVMAWQAPGDTGANGATMLPGAALLAWWVGRRVGDTPDDRDRNGVEAACGVVAAAYVVAVASKLHLSGLDWASAGNLGLQIATQGHLVGEPLQSLRLAAAASPALCSALGVATILIEGGAVFFVVPAARLPLATLLVAMHLGISVLMGLHHYDWMFTAVGWALVSAGARRG